MNVVSSRASHWLKVCKSHLRTPYIKRAEMGGGDSVTFESSFSNLAFAYLKDRAPQLLDYVLGFQLIEKSEDNDRAVGVFGFKVGPQLLYGPVFFINGELKGHELLYLKDSDTFVPMKENWINYVLGRKPNVIGEHITSQPSMHGVDRPTMDQFREAPYNKYSSAHPEWLQEGFPGLMHALGRLPRHDASVPELIKSSAEMSEQLLVLIDSCPQLVQPLTECYGPELLKEALCTAKTKYTAYPTEVARKPSNILRGSVYNEKTAEELRCEQDPITTGGLKIYVKGDTAPKGLASDQLEKLARDGVLIEDSRKEASRAFLMKRAVEDDKSLTLMNPDDTGIYEVLCKPDSFSRCLYIHAPQGARGTKPNATLVRLDDGKKAWTEAHSGEIFVEQQYAPEEYRSWFKGLPETTSLDTDSTYVLVARNGQGTGVFTVEGTLPAEGKEKCYKVCWRNSYNVSRRPDHLIPAPLRSYEWDNDSDGDDQIVMNRIKGERFVARRQSLLAPIGVKAVKLMSADDDCCCSPGGSETDSSDPPALRPGDHIDLQMGIYKTSEEMTVFKNSSEAIVNGSRMVPKAALISLVKDYGLREKTAREVLKQAEAKRGLKFRIKLAQPYSLQETAPNAPAWPAEQSGTDWLMGSGLPTSEGNTEEVPVSSMQPGNRRPLMAPPAEPMMQNIMQAAQTGQKEVLDTSLLSNLLKGSQNETLIDKHLPDLMKGLDSLGRLLFNLYWHYDKFEDRYGSSSLPELEDAMRNAFENMGDVTLELKQKTVDPLPDEGSGVEFETTN